MKKLAVFFALYAPTQAFAQTTCSDDLVASDGSTFIVCDWASGDYFAASNFCFNQFGGDLATVSNSEQNDLIANNTSATRVWLGFNDIDFEGTFVWDNGEPVTYTNWNSGEPNNSGNEDCTEMRPGGLWNDIPCTFSAVTQFVCEVEPSGFSVQDTVNAANGYAGAVDEGSQKNGLRPSTIGQRLGDLEFEYAGCATEQVAGTFGKRRNPRVQGSAAGGSSITGTSLTNIDVGGTPFTSTIGGSRFDGMGLDGRMVSGHFVRISGNNRVAWYGVIADCPQ